MAYTTKATHHFNDIREYLTIARLLQRIRLFGTGFLFQEDPSYDADLHHESSNDNNATRNDILRYDCRTDDRFHFDMASGEVSHAGSDFQLHNFESVIISGEQDNVIYGNDRDNYIATGDGFDYLYGLDGNDTFRPGSGGGWVIGGDGLDLVILNDDFELKGASQVLGDSLSSGTQLIFYAENERQALHVGDSTELIQYQGTKMTWTELWDSYRTERHDSNPYSKRENTLIGNFVNENFHGGLGRDNITGMGGADHFFMEHSHNYALDAYADRILDFDPSEGDRIKIDVSEFGYTRLEANVKVVHHSHERTEALLDGTNEFVFDTHSGELIWNRNGDDQGDGNGVIAILTGDSQTNLTNAHIDLI